MIHHDVVISGEGSYKQNILHCKQKNQIMPLETTMNKNFEFKVVEFIFYNPKVNPPKIETRVES